ncbi:hypothetical protein BASA61_006235 [Batrachochytrium salamandrivorans]|nr:hypothetical protein BASA60_000899 [Batrachochytrium salamandrivorans]KAH6587510.1 hypothetical protein BASA61_006235 [Batrachochytrium salamandrivorans]KAH9274132.1 hypothetical protein BASA83_003434 [Batrachochytrium salamandrivorans]
MENRRTHSVDLLQQSGPKQVRPPTAFRDMVSRREGEPRSETPHRVHDHHATVGYSIKRLESPFPIDAPQETTRPAPRGDFESLTRSKATSLPLLSLPDTQPPASPIRSRQNSSRQATTTTHSSTRPDSYSSRGPTPSAASVHIPSLPSYTVQSHIDAHPKRLSSESNGQPLQSGSTTGLVYASSTPIKNATAPLTNDLEVHGSGRKMSIRSRPPSSSTRMFSLDGQKIASSTQRGLMPSNPSLAGVSKLASIQSQEPYEEDPLYGQATVEKTRSDSRSNHHHINAAEGSAIRLRNPHRPSRPLPEQPPWNRATRPSFPGRGSLEEKPERQERTYTTLAKPAETKESQNQSHRNVQKLTGLMHSNKSNLPAKISVMSRSEPMLSNEKPHQLIGNLDMGSSTQSGLDSSTATATSTLSSRFDQRPATCTSGRYRATPLQWDIYTRLQPSKDEKESPSYTPYIGSQFNISQAYRIDNHNLNSKDLEKCTNKVCALYSIVRTKFYRNDRILDADVEGVIDQCTWPEFPANAYLEVVSSSMYPHLAKYDTGSNDWTSHIAAIAKSWMSPIGISIPFGILAITFPPKEVTPHEKQPALGYTVMVVAATLAVVDEISLTWISRELVALYRECYRLRKMSRGDSEVVACIHSRKTIESEEFADFANECKRAKSDMSFWRSQCIEVKQDNVDRNEKDDLEGQLKRLCKEKVALGSSLASLAKRKTEVQTDLTELRRQRGVISKSESGEGVISTYVDAANGEVIQITHEAKKALIKAVLGEDASTDNIVGLLDKHEVPKDAQLKIKAPTLTLEAFAAFTEIDVEYLGLMSRDRRKIIALAEFVRNRIKECLHEQGKVKFALERKIAKASRDLESALEGLTSTQNLLESTDDMSIRLNYILKPPYIETKLAPITLAAHYETNMQSSDTFDSSSRWGFVPLEIEPDTLDTLRRFRANWTLSTKIRQRQRKADPSVSSDNESLLDSEKSDNDDKTVLGDSPLKYESSPSLDRAFNTMALDHHPRHVKYKSVDVICLAAFSILLKHISGSEKYIIGVSQSYRRHGLFIGPLSDTMPIKVDVTQPGLTFDVLYGSMHKILRDTKRHGVACTNMQVASAFGITCGLDVRFEFIGLRESKEWIKRGLSVADLLCQPERCFHVDGIDTARIWSDNEADTYDVKLIIVETPGGLEGGMRFMNCRFSKEIALKWMLKYTSVLEGIDCGPRKILVSSLISRFYHTVWQGGSTSNLLSNTSLYSSLSSNNKLNRS